MSAAAGEVPEEPGVDGAEGDLTALGSVAQAGGIVQEPSQLGCGEVGVDDQAGLGADGIDEAIAAKIIADSGGAAVLPDDGVCGRLAGPAIPDDGGLALVGDSNRVHLIG